MPSFLPNLEELRGLVNSLYPVRISDEPTSSRPAVTRDITDSETIGAIVNNVPTDRRTQAFPPASENSTVISDAGVGSHSNTDTLKPGSTDEMIRLRGKADATEERNKSRKVPVDLYCIVRPPAMSGKSQMNLQIQLVIKPSSSAPPTRSSSCQIPLETDVKAISPSGAVVDANTGAEDSMVDGSAHEVADARGPTAGATLTSGDPPSRTISRSDSVSSEFSAGSTVGSQSTTSVTGGGRARKRVEPLFNLAVHNLFPTVVTDAATDVRVAKRTVDVTGVGCLEPSEIWHVRPLDDRLAALRSDDEESFRSASRPASLHSSRAIPSSPAPPRSSCESLTPRDVTTEGAGIVRESRVAGRLFGKLFKKRRDIRSYKDGPAVNLSNTLTDVSSSTYPLVPSRPAAILSVGAGLRSSAPIGPANLAPEPSVLGPATFGLSPVVLQQRSSAEFAGGNLASSATRGAQGSHHPSAHGSVAATEDHYLLPTLQTDKANHAAYGVRARDRPSCYNWTVKRWAKRPKESWAGSILSTASLGIEFPGGYFTPGGEDEVAFEWRRMAPSETSRPKARLGLQRSSTAGTFDRGDFDERQSLTQMDRQPDNDMPSHGIGSTIQPHIEVNGRVPLVTSDTPFLLDARPQTLRRISTASCQLHNHRSASLYRQIAQEGDDQSLASTEEEPTDHPSPEDDDTPWTCTVLVKRTGIRQFLGTLTPAVHHPKVLGILKMPSSLQAIDVGQDLKVQLRVTAGPGNGGVHHRKDGLTPLGGGVVLTEENLKDVVCVTALWIVAREEFGGLGRKRKV